MVDLIKFASESVTSYICTLIMLLGISTLIAGTVNAIVKQIGMSIINIILARRINISESDNDE